MRLSFCCAKGIPGQYFVPCFVMALQGDFVRGQKLGPADDMVAGRGQGEALLLLPAWAELPWEPRWVGWGVSATPPCPPIPRGTSPSLRQSKGTALCPLGRSLARCGVRAGDSAGAATCRRPVGTPGHPPGLFGQPGLVGPLTVTGTGRAVVAAAAHVPPARGVVLGKRRFPETRFWVALPGFVLGAKPSQGHGGFPGVSTPLQGLALAAPILE